MSVFFGTGKPYDEEQIQEPEEQWLKKKHNSAPVAQCCCPSVVIYLIETDCLNINNGGCPGWIFCNGNLIPPNGCRKGE